MPLDIQSRPGAPDASHRPAPTSLSGSAVVIGLINNMPDSALDGTELQFRGLLAAAAGDRTVRLRLASLPEVPRGAEARAKIASRYWTLDELWEDAPDAIIVTGTEPKTAVLSDEPYWPRLVELIEYADANLISSVWSCLAAHAAVLHLDGIARQRLTAKRFGVFKQQVVQEHTLTKGLDGEIAIPHSRWNNLPVDALAAADYRVLTRSVEHNADLFVKQRRSLLVFFQGHPEYDERALLKEYQRDVGRFISGEYREYPAPPPGYFTPEGLALLSEFEQQVRAREPARPLGAFPFAALAASIQAAWLAPAAQIYQNWLSLIAARKKGD
jgi:homoserine O-succinyltransferase/O-acetyltransferase